MNRVRRYLIEPGDDALLRSAAGAVLGAVMALVPPLSGLMDRDTFLSVFVIGVVAILPGWRQAGGALNKPIAIMTFLTLVAGPVIVAWAFSRIAILTFVGGWATTLGVLRFVSGWRDSSDPTVDPVKDPDGASRLLPWVVLLPVLVVVAVVVLGVALGRDARP